MINILKIIKLSIFIPRYLNSILFPIESCVCGKYSKEAVCNKCWSEVILITTLACKKCSKPYYNQYLHSEKIELICEECAEIPLYFERSISYGIYQDVMIKIIYEYKFNNKVYISKFLGKKLSTLIKNEDDYKNIEIIISVPMYKNKERRRGYNQSYLLAKEIAKDLKLKLIKNILIKIKDTEPQSKKPMRERRQNIRGSFFVKDPMKIKGKEILLIDDVFTTGSTVNECSRILRQAGAKKIYVATIARTS